MSRVIDCEYAERGEWGPIIECDHPKAIEINAGYCNKDKCPELKINRVVHDESYSR